MGKAGVKRLVQLASKQFGVVSARDFAECDVSDKWLRRRIDTGEWIRLQRGVYRLGAQKPTLDEQEMAALLAAGNGAVLSHESAARRLGLDVQPCKSVQITIPASRDIPKLSGVRVWHSRDLIERDTIKRGPFRLTHLARTMLDLASVLDDTWLRAALDSVLRQRKSNLAWISQLLERRGNGRRGATRLRALVAEYQHDGEVPDSVLESLAIELARATLHEPRLHFNVLDGPLLIAEVDLAWPEVQLCVELDGWARHGTRAAFAEDRARDRGLQRLGWMVLRYTWQDVAGDRDSVIEELVAAYQSRAGSGRSRARREVACYRR
jgi:very-short-patch-repair endonuclease/predicted transcriptional regulator of viral defense system